MRSKRRCIALLVPPGEQNKNWAFSGFPDEPHPTFECVGLTSGYFLFDDGSTAECFKVEPMIDPGSQKPDWPFPDFKPK